jgi:hypothetical protein
MDQEQLIIIKTAPGTFKRMNCMDIGPSGGINLSID